MVRLQVIQGDAATDAELAAAEASRPKTRGDCVDGPRPCPRVGCRYHLLTHINRHGRLALNGIPNRSSDEEVIDRLFSMEETCALDVADGVEGSTMNRAAVGALMGLSRERVRHLERQEPAEKLQAGFEPWFGERRSISRGVEPDQPKPKPFRFIYPEEVRTRAVEIYGDKRQRKKALDYVESETGRRPAIPLFYSWVSNMRKHGRPGFSKTARKQHFITQEMLGRVWELKQSGMTHEQVAEKMTESYGRRPYAGTVSNWVKRARELFGDNT